MTVSSSFKRSKTAASIPASPTLSDVSLDGPARKPSRKSTAQTRPARPKPGAHATLSPPAPSLDAALSDDEHHGSEGASQDDGADLLMRLMEAHKNQRAKESHDLQKKSGAVRSEALRKAEEMLKNAHSQAQAQTAAAQDKGRETIAKEHKRSRAVREKWEQEARSLLNDTAHAIKDLKAGQKESAKEIDDFRRSSERMVAALGTTHDKIVSSANTKIQGLLTKPPPIAGILAEINKMARAVQEDEEL